LLLTLSNVVFDAFKLRFSCFTTRSKLLKLRDMNTKKGSESNVNKALC